MVDTQMTCQGCGKQFKNREELQKHEKECAAIKHIQSGQQGNVQPGSNKPNPSFQEPRKETGSQQSPSRNQPEKTRTAGGGGGDSGVE